MKTCSWLTTKMSPQAMISFATLFLAFAGFAQVTSPESERAAFKVAEGFEVSLFASEKDGIVKPIQMRFDAHGRLWVIGSSVYPQLAPGQKPDDKVLVLEDADGDGRADKTTVFADGLMIPTGIETVENGCYVGHGTELLLLRDTNGDLKADERRVVLRGFGTGDNHQNINSFLWGPGGELFFCQGLHIHSHVETPWGISSLTQAGLWRLRPRLLKLDGFYGSANEPQNPWGWVFTDWGEPIVIAGNNSSHIYPVPGMVVDRREEAPPQIWKNGSGRKCSNGDIVGNAHFPDSLQGALIVGGYLNNAVWALKIREDGAGFALDDLPPLLRSTNSSFRPVDAKFGPDGALYIADWCNPIIGHYQASFRHPDRDKTRGRIWRVTAKGRPLTRTPKLATASTPALLDALASSNRWTRQFAKRVLAEKSFDELRPALKAWLQQTNLSEHALKEVLGVYQSHEAVAPELLKRLAQAQNPSARAYAASVAGAWSGRLTNGLEVLRTLARDEHPRVRLQAIVACTYFTNAAAYEVVASAADFPADRFLQYAFRQATHSLKPYWHPALTAGRLNLEGKIERLAMMVRADGSRDVLGATRALLQNPQATPAERQAYAQVMAEIGGPEDLHWLLLKGDDRVLAAALPVLVKSARVNRTRPSGDAAELLLALLQRPDEFLRAEALVLGGLWRARPLQAIATTAVFNERESETFRSAAITALGYFGDSSSLPLLQRVATSSERPTLRNAAVVAMTSLDFNQAASSAAELLAQPATAASSGEILTAFLNRQGGAEALTSAFQRVAPSREAAAAALAALNASGRREESLSQVLTRAAGFRLQLSSMNATELASFVDEVKRGGNARRGAEIYRRPELGCVACHAVHGEGGNIGPNLSALGSAQPIDFIVGAILEPQKEVKEGYTSIAVTTADGEEYQGYQVRETTQELVLRDVAQNQEVRLRRADVREKRQNGSVMPAGLVDTLTRDEFRDLVRYLSKLGRTR
jgi:putative heme-binding domain-containing protein